MASRQSKHTQLVIEEFPLPADYFRRRHAACRQNPTPSHQLLQEQLDLDPSTKVLLVSIVLKIFSPLFTFPLCHLQSKVRIAVKAN